MWHDCRYEGDWGGGGVCSLHWFLMKVCQNSLMSQHLSVGETHGFGRKKTFQSVEMGLFSSSVVNQLSGIVVECPACDW